MRTVALAHLPRRAGVAVQEVREQGIVRDGLYRVVTSYLCAGFVIENARIVACAPILRRKLGYWMTVAQWVGP